VVVPARNEETTITALLDSLSKQTRPPQEIVVVDAGSVDRTAQIVREYRVAGTQLQETRAAPAIPVRLLSMGPAFPGIARNAGAGAAVSEYIAFTDAGIQLDPHWLENLCAALSPIPSAIAPRPDVIFGNYEPVLSNFFDRCAATAYVPARVGKPGHEIRGPVIASCLMRRSIVVAVGGFPRYRASEDLIFLETIQQRGWGIAYAPAAVAHWEMAASWRSTYRRFTLYSYHNLIAHRGKYWHHGVARFYLVAAPFLILGCVSRTVWLAVPILGACARAGVTIWRKRKENWGGAFNPLRWIVVGLLLLLLDAATFSGALWWAWDRLRGRLPVSTPSDGETSHEATPA
jgi:glycosyltransferase involved in cell wall biosynthesis